LYFWRSCPSFVVRQDQVFRPPFPQTLTDQFIVLILEARSSRQLSPVRLLNTPAVYKIECLFPNARVRLHILLAMPAIVASAERSYSKLKLIKNSEIRSPRRLINADNWHWDCKMDWIWQWYTKLCQEKARKAPLLS